jgi:hypothetical protein
MEEKNNTYAVYSAGLDGRPLVLQATYHTVAEVLAHCEERAIPYAIKVDGKFLSLDAFMESYVAAG